MSRISPALALVAAAFLAAAPVAAPTALGAEIVPSLHLTGTGEVAAAPDMAIVTSGVITQAKTARDALSANNEAMENLMAALVDAGIEPSDIQTSNFSVQPEFTYPESNGVSVRRIDGYTVSNSVTVRVLDLDNLGRMLDRFVSVGANQINSISFAVQDPAPLIEEARKAAVADALAKAALYAEAAGLTLGDILSITESGSAPRPIAEAAMMRLSAADSAVPVAAGELTFSSSVNIQWQIGEPR